VTGQSIESYSAREALENEFKKRFPEKGRMPNVSGEIFQFLHDMIEKLMEVREVKEEVEKMRKEMETMKLQMTTLVINQKQNTGGWEQTCS
jgi:hypothetical protein